MCLSTVLYCHHRYKNSYNISNSILPHHNAIHYFCLIFAHLVRKTMITIIIIHDHFYQTKTKFQFRSTNDSLKTSLFFILQKDSKKKDLYGATYKIIYVCIYIKYNFFLFKFFDWKNNFPRSIWHIVLFD